MNAGDLISWHSSSWNLTNVEEVFVSKEEICQKHKIDYIFVNFKMAFKDAVNTCNGLRGKLPLVTTENQIHIINATKLDSPDFRGSSLFQCIQFTFPNNVHTVCV